MKVLNSLNLGPFTTHSHHPGSCTAKEITSKDAGATYVQAATQNGFPQNYSFTATYSHGNRLKLLFLQPSPERCKLVKRGIP